MSSEWCDICNGEVDTTTAGRVCGHREIVRTTDNTVPEFPASVTEKRPTDKDTIDYLTGKVANLQAQLAETKKENRTLKERVAELVKGGQDGMGDK